MQSIKIRAARPDDAAAIRALERAVVAATLPLVREMPALDAVAEPAGPTVNDALRLVAVAAGAARPDTFEQTDTGAHTDPDGHAHKSVHPNLQEHGNCSAHAHANAHGQADTPAHASAHAHGNARVVGMIAVTVLAAGPADSARPHIRALAVAAPYRRRGVGLCLLRRAEEWAQEHGFNRLATNVAADNHAALAFFHRAGYHEERGVLVKQLVEDQPCES